MNVAVIGSGGREHALALKISQSEKLSKLYILPGNPGTAQIGENIEIGVGNYSGIVEFCTEKKIDLIVIGPEKPLVDGLADLLRSEGFAVFGPGQKSAMIEGDKAFSKSLMKKHGIPTAKFEIFESSQYEETIKYLETSRYPIVIKASGLAAGKGVLICNDIDEAKSALNDCYNRSIFGDAGNIVVIEEFLIGEEASIFVITDGEKYITLPASQDHKRIFDGDKGKNTGGMGAYAPAPLITGDLLKTVENEIIIPTLSALRKDVERYNGCLYCGLMITDEGPKVIEYNCRFGDPEIQAVLPIIEGDFLKLLYSTAIGEIDTESVKYNGGAAVCVVAASGGYPDEYKKGYEITGLKEAETDNIIVYHAGTKFENDKIVTNGGRVLGVTSYSIQNDLKHCKTESYNALVKINFTDIFYRKDIADRALK